MKSIKRFVALALVSILALGMLTGCANGINGTSSVLGDFIVEEAVKNVNAARAADEKEALKNDTALKRELDRLLAEIDPATLEISGENARQIWTDSTGTHISGKYLWVATDDLYLWAGDEDDDEDEEEATTVIHALNINTENVEKLIDALNRRTRRLAPSMTAVAFSYRVVNNTYLCVAYGYTTEIDL